MEINPVFVRRLYLCWLLAHKDKPNVPRLMQLTGWPRRTLQDVLKALPGMGVTLCFVEQGVRHNDGYYTLTDWGPLDAEWIAQHADGLLACLDQPVHAEFARP
ncbi:winged helix-turn-helix domain-containing protein [Edwardsiella ictaluri]|uniref:winged helix-turn-helix domain-containing protein n=1 Tax=Edwardsiella ictaluri TaxID=67780 RepID=UPI0039F66FF7